MEMHVVLATRKVQGVELSSDSYLYNHGETRRSIMFDDQLELEMTPNLNN